MKSMKSITQSMHLKGLSCAAQAERDSKIIPSQEMCEIISNTAESLQSTDSRGNTLLLIISMATQSCNTQRPPQAKDTVYCPSRTQSCVGCMRHEQQENTGLTAAFALKRLVSGNMTPRSQKMAERSSEAFLSFCATSNTSEEHPRKATPLLPEQMDRQTRWFRRCTDTSRSDHSGSVCVVVMAG